MAKIIEYNKESKLFSLVERNKSFSSYDKYDLEDFDSLKKLLDESGAEEFKGRYDRLMFRNQPKSYYIFYPPKSGGGQPHIELSVHPDSTFNFTEVYDPNDFLDSSIRVQLTDKRRFKSMSISHKDYDLLATWFDMEVSHKNQLRLGSNVVKIEDLKTDFNKVINSLNVFADGFNLNDIKKVFPFDQLSEYFISKVGKDAYYSVKFLKGSMRISMVMDRKPVIVLSMDSKGHLVLDVIESILQSTIGSENLYKLTFEPMFNCGKWGFTDLTLHTDLSDKLSPINNLFKDYKDGAIFKLK